MRTHHKAKKIVARRGYYLSIEFDLGQVRWVNLHGLITRHPSFQGIRTDSILDKAKIEDGDFELNRVKISGPTLYHMGEVNTKPGQIGT